MTYCVESVTGVDPGDKGWGLMLKFACMHVCLLCGGKALICKVSRNNVLMSLP